MHGVCTPKRAREREKDREQDVLCPMIVADRPVTED